MVCAVYPGTFDPFTKGHLAVLKRSCLVFDKVIVAVHSGAGKKCLFSLDERIAAAEESICAAKIKKAEVAGFSTLLTSFLKKNNIRNVVRGVRLPGDFGQELEMALVNLELLPDINIMFFPSVKDHLYISSSRVKELAEYGADISGMVSNKTAKRLIKKINGKS